MRRAVHDHVPLIIYSDVNVLSRSAAGRSDSVERLGHGRKCVVVMVMHDMMS